MQGVSLTPATGSDLDLVMTLERAPGFREFMLPWPQEKHQHAMADPTYRYLLIESNYEAAKDARGFVILQVLGEDRPAVEIIRIAANPPGRGIGEQALELIKSMAFEELGARKLWLDVFDYNERARHVYRKAGFVDEALFRECIQDEGDSKSLVIMAIAPPSQRPEFAELEQNS